MMMIFHRSCGGPALEADPGRSYDSLLGAKQLSLICFTCLEEITDASELRVGEEMGNYHQPR